jgi:hypothetical protein
MFTRHIHHCINYIFVNISDLHILSHCLCNYLYIYIYIIKYLPSLILSKLIMVTNQMIFIHRLGMKNCAILKLRNPNNEFKVITFK